MWLFTTRGVYSIVEKGGRRGQLCVRARDRDDLDRLRETYLPKLGPTVTNEGTDYPFRSYASRRAVARAAAQAVLDIHYANFKNEVHDQLGPKREGVLHRVWAALLSLEPPRVGATSYFQRGFADEPEELYDDEPWHTTRCRVCSAEVSVYDAELDATLPDEELLAQVKRISDDVAAECEFNDTGSHWGESLEEAFAS